MFQFPGFASRLRVMTGLATRRVAPFGHLGITACVPLPRASRSLPRPSSPPCAQASPTCLPSLDYKYLSPSRTTRIVSKRVTFSCEKVISKDSSIPRSTIHPLSNSDDPRGVSQGVNNREWNGQNVSKRSDYVSLSPFPRERLLGSVKEVIQPQVPLRLPCYDFTPVTDPTVASYLPCGLAHLLKVEPTPMV